MRGHAGPKFSSPEEEAKDQRRQHRALIQRVEDSGIERKRLAKVLLVAATRGGTRELKAEAVRRDDKIGGLAKQELHRHSSLHEFFEGSVDPSCDPGARASLASWAREECSSSSPSVRAHFAFVRELETAAIASVVAAFEIGHGRWIADVPEWAQSLGGVVNHLVRSVGLNQREIGFLRAAFSRRKVPRERRWPIPEKQINAAHDAVRRAYGEFKRVQVSEKKTTPKKRSPKRTA